MISIQDLLQPEDEPLAKTERNLETSTKQESFSTETTNFVIEFVLDTICPLCYIGMVHLNRAIEMYKTQHPDATFEVTCSPFILNPTAPQHSDKTKRGYYAEIRNYPPSWFQRWTELGAQAGINFRWDGPTGNARNSHKLLRLALEPGPTVIRSTAFVFAQRSRYQNSYDSSSSESRRGPALQMRILETLLRGYFEENTGLSGHEWLTEVGMSVGGFSKEEVLTCLESEEWGLAIDTLDAEVRSRLAHAGISGIPAFIIQGRLLASGYQQPEFFLQHFERIRTSGAR